jgi:hypothetical protein
MRSARAAPSGTARSVTFGRAAHDLAEQLVGLLTSAAVRLRVIVVDQRLPLRLTMADRFVAVDNAFSAASGATT